MGLPLYHPPVESDIKIKTDLQNPPTRARSVIRRNRRTRIVDVPGTSSASPGSVVRWRRHGSRTTPPTAESQWTPWDNNEPNDPSVVPQMTPRTNNSYTLGRGSSGRPPHPAVRELIGRNGPMSQEIVAFFGERMASLYAGSSPSQPHNPEYNPEGDEHEASSGPTDEDPRSWILSSDTPLSHTSQSARSSQRPTLRRGQSVRREPIRHLSNPDVGRLVREEPRRDARRDRRVDRIRRRPNSVELQDSRHDGLGDRDRSLSPEGDGVWDTLLSSITPDPQPPSVGSSFASTSASAAASQSTATGASSSNTSFSGPAAEGADESAFVCESAGENSDTEGDEDDDNPLTRFPTYADVVAHERPLRSRHNEDHASRLLEDFGDAGMQRIVRTLASRQDIPDEWWAEIGLSRSS